MRTLKKTLALVLVVAMVLSFGVIGASADFTDVKADNEYKTAIDVLSGIGVINGMTSTTFEPDGSLTRAQAAKIIAYMLLGTTNAELISSATSQKFSDVPTSHWAAGYIEYCANIGVINGVGDGKFAPEGKLTTAAFTKMLLVALGYKATSENFVGSSWAINVASKAVTAGVYDETIVISDATTATRGQAAQLAYKTLTADCVEYYGGSTVTIAGVEVITGATLRKVTNVTSEYRDYVNAGTAAGQNDIMQFCEKYFPKLKQSQANLDGRTGYTWVYGSKTISTFVSKDNVLATSANGTTYADLTDPTNSKFIKYKADDTVKYYYNDAIASASWPTANSNEAANITAIQGKAATAGIVVKFIDTNDNGKYDTVSVIEKTVVALTGAPSTRTSGSVTYVTIPGTAIPSTTTSDNITYPANLVKGDVVLWYKSGSHYYVEAATAISATMTSYSNRGYVVDGTTYKLASLTGVTVPGTASSATDKMNALVGLAGYTYYVDGNNNVVFVKAPDNTATLSNTVYVSAIDSKMSFGKTTYQAMLVKTDGSTETVTISKTATNGGTMTTVDGVDTIADGKLSSGTFAIPSVNSDGSYNLRYAANQAQFLTDLGSDNTLSSDDTSYLLTGRTVKFLTQVKYTSTWPNTASGTYAKVNSKDVMGTANTLFLYYNSSSKTYEPYTGINNAPNYSAGGSVYVLTDTNGYALLVVATGGTSSASATSYDKIFVTSGPSASLDANNTLMYTYAAVVNGVADQTVTSYQTLNAGTLYYCRDYATNGAIASGAALTVVGATAYASVTDVDYASGTMVITGATSGTCLLSSDCAIFMFDKSEQSLTQPSAETVAAYDFSTGNGTVTLVPVSTTDPSIATIYITVA